MAENDDDDEKKSNVWLIGLSSSIVILFIWLLTLFFLPMFIVESAERGQFGDMFGSVNALFSGWAFVGVIVAILLQKQELELQRKELAETREEFKLQNETLSKQRFENTFFNMVGLHNETLNLFEASFETVGLRDGQPSKSELIKGRDVFRYIYNKSLVYLWVNRDLSTSKCQTIDKIYEKVDEEYNHILGHYFRSLYRIIRFVDKSNLSKDEKSRYIKILRAQFSNFELLMLFYNCAYYQDVAKFKGGVEKYSLLNNLPKDKVLDQVHLGVYDASAYGW